MPSSSALAAVVALGLAAAPPAAAIDYSAAMPILERRADIVPRQTDGPSLGGLSVSGPCISVASSVFGSIPTPPPEIQPELVKAAGSDLCKFTPPASLTNQFSSYSSQLVSWISENESKLSPCSGALSQISAVAGSSCSSIPGAAATASGGSNSGNAANGEARSGSAAAPRQSGIAVAAAAVAAAGFVVMAL
ncbi:hypothetical protein CDD83_957 [Cordyceps sp. RAO-2017]|nr:hypothetical protein CDD83_957 [Cordyceps sp. RAO-2017]